MLRVVKVGGSLLLRPSLPDDLRRWIANQSVAEQWFLFGGGELIDSIRHLDRLRPEDPATVHWRCVDLLQFTFETASSWWPQWPVIDSPQALATAVQKRRDADAASSADTPRLISVRSFYHRGSEADLPRTWSTTTDSIAAYLSHQINADELVLLKSCSIDPADSMEMLAQKGIVDDAFPRIARGLTNVRVERLAGPIQ